MEEPSLWTGCLLQSAATFQLRVMSHTEWRSGVMDAQVKIAMELIEVWRCSRPSRATFEASLLTSSMAPA